MPSQEPSNLFVYGTLTEPQRVEALTGRQFRRVEASLFGFARLESELGYPFILPTPGVVVHGVLLFAIDPVSLERLDAYEAEGDLYRRQAVEVVVAGRVMPAMTYVGQAIGAAAPQRSRPSRGVRAPQSPSDVTTSPQGMRASTSDEH